VAAGTWRRSSPFDTAVDHLSPTVREELAVATLDGSTSISRTSAARSPTPSYGGSKRFSRISVCGLVSGYHA
jgi:hypothetical protein